MSIQEILAQLQEQGYSVEITTDSGCGYKGHITQITDTIVRVQEIIENKMKNSIIALSAIEAVDYMNDKSEVVPTLQPQLYLIDDSNNGDA